MNTDEYLPKNTVPHEIQGQESFLLSKEIGNQLLKSQWISCNFLLINLALEKNFFCAVVSAYSDNKKSEAVHQRCSQEKVQSNFIEITLQYGCFINFLHIFRTPLEDCFWKTGFFSTAFCKLLNTFRSVFRTQSNRTRKNKGLIFVYYLDFCSIVIFRTGGDCIPKSILELWNNSKTTLETLTENDILIKLNEVPLIR